MRSFTLRITFFVRTSFSLPGGFSKSILLVFLYETCYRCTVLFVTTLRNCCAIWRDDNPSSIIRMTVFRRS